MECKKLRTLSKVSLVISVLPLATLIPVFLKLTLPGGVSTAWAVNSPSSQLYASGAMKAAAL